MILPSCRLLCNFLISDETDLFKDYILIVFYFVWYWYIDIFPQCKRAAVSGAVCVLRRHSVYGAAVEVFTLEQAEVKLECRSQWLAETPLTLAVQASASAIKQTPLLLQQSLKGVK